MRIFIVENEIENDAEAEAIACAMIDERTLTANDCH